MGAVGGNDEQAQDPQTATPETAQQDTENGLLYITTREIASRRASLHGLSFAGHTVRMASTRRMARADDVAPC